MKIAVNVVLMRKNNYFFVSKYNATSIGKIDDNIIEVDNDEGVKISDATFHADLNSALEAHLFRVNPNYVMLDSIDGLTDEAELEGLVFCSIREFTEKRDDIEKWFGPTNILYAGDAQVHLSMHPDDMKKSADECPLYIRVYNSYCRSKVHGRVLFVTDEELSFIVDNHFSESKGG